MLYNFKLFVLQIVAKSYNCLLRIIISYLKPYLYLPTPPLGQDMTQGQFLSGV